MRVGIDLDGVGYDFGQSCLDYAKSIGQDLSWKDSGVEPHHWDFYKHWGWSTEEFVDFCNAGADAGYIFSGGVRPGFVETVGRINSLGHRVVIITDRKFGANPGVSERATVEWLGQHEIEYDELVFSADKTVVPTDFFVEDKRENHDALRAAGSQCFLINRPWNLDETYGQFDGRHRIDTIHDFGVIVETCSGWVTPEYINV